MLADDLREALPIVITYKCVSHLELAPTLSDLTHTRAVVFAYGFLSDKLVRNLYAHRSADAQPC